MKSSKRNTKTRKLTVSRKYVASRYNNGRYDPKILIAGKWLTECGFKAGDKLVLKVYDKKIIIELNNDQSDQSV